MKWDIAFAYSDRVVLSTAGHDPGQTKTITPQEFFTEPQYAELRGDPSPTPTVKGTK